MTEELNLWPVPVLGVDEGAFRCHHLLLCLTVTDLVRSVEDFSSVSVRGVNEAVNEVLEVSVHLQSNPEDLTKPGHSFASSLLTGCSVENVV